MVHLPHVSDIDLLAVTSTALDVETRKELAADLLKLPSRLIYLSNK